MDRSGGSGRRDAAGVAPPAAARGRGAAGIAGTADPRRRRRPSRLERALHEGAQQHLFALAVNLQLAGELAGRRSRCGEALLDEMRQDVQHALEEAAQPRGADLPTAPRDGGPRGGAALGRGGRRRSGLALEVAPGVRFPPEVARPVYLCCTEAFGRAGARSPSTIRCERRGRALVIRVVEEVAMRAPSCADRCAARSRRDARWPADDPVVSRAAVSASPARSRARDDASRSPPGRGSRP